ncbi:LAFA_0D03422g1_1 [Lachancea sp. 'fantastica']|nr:LAFA_0D03422g1_1 [Lachancea sp. 'fantastica']
MVQVLSLLLCALLAVLSRLAVTKLITKKSLSKIILLFLLLVISRVPVIRASVPYLGPFAFLYLVVDGSVHSHEFALKSEPTLRQLPTYGVEEKEGYAKSSHPTIATRPIIPDQLELSAEIERIIDYIIRDFVTVWYKSIDNRPNDAPFVSELRCVMDNIIRNLRDALSNVDFSELLILKMLPVLTRHFKAFRAAHKTVSGQKISKNDMGTGDQNFTTAVEFGRDYKIHKSISLGLDDLPVCLEKYSRVKADFLLQRLVNQRELSSRFVKILGREILCCNLLSPLLQKITEPHFLNDFLIATADSLLEERIRVKEIRAALSSQLSETQQVPHLASDETAALSEIVINIEADPKVYEDLLKGISCAKSEEALKAVKILLMCQVIKLKKTDVLSKNSSPSLNRLSLALNLVESRLKYFSTNMFEPPSSHAGFKSEEFVAFRKYVESLSTADVIRDKTCLRYFLEYLKMHDTKGHRCLKFWLKVEEFKNPLEDPSNGELAVISEEGFDDLIKIATDFFSGRNLYIMQSLSEQCTADVVSLLSALKQGGRPAASEHHQAARRSFLRLQSLAYEFLGLSCFPAFKQSKDFLRMISVSGVEASRAFEKPAIEPEANPEYISRTSVGVIADNNLQDRECLDVENSPVEGLAIIDKARNRTPYSGLFGSREESSLFENKIFEEDYSDGDAKNSSDEESSEPSYLADSLERHKATWGEESDPDLAVKNLNQSTLKNTIAELTISIDRLKKQLSLLNHLGLKADLTDDVPELKLLKKSEKAVNREVLQQELLRQQLLVQEDANSLYEKCQTSIKTYLSDISPNSGREVVFYVVSVTHVSNEIVTSWDVPRRYSEFYELNAYLKERYGGTIKYFQRRDYFPEKVKMSLVYHVSKNLLYKERTVKLERFLRCLLKMPEICQDTYFRKFLTDTNTVFTIKRRAPNESRIKLLSRVDSVSSKLFEPVPNVPQPRGKAEPEQEAKIDPSQLQRTEDVNFEKDDSKKRSFIRPLCEFLATVFSLKDSRSSWLRGRALLVVIQQLLGSTIEKYIRDSIDAMTNPKSTAMTAKKIRLKLWVDGVFFKKLEAAGSASKKEDASRTSIQAKNKIQSLMAETCGRVFGVRKSRETASDIHLMLQNEYLNASLLLELVDILLAELFPGVT